MQRLSLEEASSREWDVVIAGSSFAAMFFGCGLPDELDVLYVEKGADYSHNDQLERGWAVRENFTQQNHSGEHKNWVAFSLFGGNSNYWWGNAPRLHPDDFSLNSKFGVGKDWPFLYEDIEPFWEKAEDIIQVAGGECEHILPRRKPFPYPGHIPSRADEALRASSPLWVPLPTGISNGGSRPVCCTNGVCRICPVGAKFTVLNGLEALNAAGSHVLLDTEVRAVDIEGGKARAVRVRSADGSEARLRANTVALGTNGIFNSAILKRSGVQNSALGKYLHEQAVIDVHVDTANIKSFYGGTSETGHGYHFYHEIDRSSAAAVLIETVNAPVSIRPEPGKWANRIHFRMVAEDIPQAENQVILEDDEPIIEWHGYTDYAKLGLDRAKAGLADIIPDTIENVAVSPLLGSEAHIQGTHRMGTSPDDSVVDEKMRLHGAANVFVLGAGSFPSCSPANPTLTICALSLLASEAVA